MGCYPLPTRCCFYFYYAHDEPLVCCYVLLRLLRTKYCILRTTTSSSYYYYYYYYNYDYYRYHYQYQYSYHYHYYCCPPLEAVADSGEWYSDTTREYVGAAAGGSRSSSKEW